MQFTLNKPFVTNTKRNQALKIKNKQNMLFQLKYNNKIGGKFTQDCFEAFTSCGKGAAQQQLAFMTTGSKLVGGVT